MGFQCASPSQRPILLLSEEFGVRLEMIAAGILKACHGHNLGFSWQHFERYTLKSGREAPLGIVVNGRRKFVQTLLKSSLARLPVVSTAGGTLGMPLTTIAADVDEVSHLVVDHLLEEGARDFIYAGPASDPSSEWRARSAERELASKLKNFRFVAFDVQRDDDFWGSSSSISRRFVRLLKKLRPPIGVITFTDRVAVSCMECAATAGLAVPREVLVVGTGNHPIYSSMEVPLSSVKVDYLEMGRRAVEIILRRHKEGSGAGDPQVEQVGVELVARASSRLKLLRDPQISQVVEYLHGHYHEPLRLAELARKMGMSRTTLVERFRRAVGESPMRYLARHRMERARYFLVETPLNISEIAYRLGFDTPEYFTRAFRRNFGVSPSGYRCSACGR